MRSFLNNKYESNAQPCPSVSGSHHRPRYGERKVNVNLFICCQTSCSLCGASCWAVVNPGYWKKNILPVHWNLHTLSDLIFTVCQTLPFINARISFNISNQVWLVWHSEKSIFVPVIVSVTAYVNVWFLRNRKHSRCFHRVMKYYWKVWKITSLFRLWNCIFSLRAPSLRLESELVICFYQVIQQRFL